MSEPSLQLTVRSGHPDFLDIPWTESIVTWETPHLIDRPKGISRHEVRFLDYDGSIYVVKELPLRAAQRDFEVLSALENHHGLAVSPVGLVEYRHPDPSVERSAALITAFLEHSFSYRELLQGPGFGQRRDQMLDAFAGLLVELHLAGCYWGDCSLSNVLYRFDAQALDAVMVDAETAVIHPSLSDRRRDADLDIMIENVAGGMADIAAALGMPIDEADLWLGEDIARRYENLWCEISRVEYIGADERYRITERIERLNTLGFNVREVDLTATGNGDRLELETRVSSRDYHASQLRELTGIEASEWQAWQMLTDIYYFRAQDEERERDTLARSALTWRMSVFEPMVERLRAIEGITDPIQGYCDLLHHRYVRSVENKRDIGTETAMDDWLASGRPGYRL